MSATLQIKVKVLLLPLSRASIRAIHNLVRYEYVVFTSKNARKLFGQVLRELRLKPLRNYQIIQVGPRADILKFQLRGKRVLFPRSTLAPYDIVRKMRVRGTIVRTIYFYTAHGVQLSGAQRKSLIMGKVKKLYFKSPSGIDGLLRQFRGRERTIILAIPALCIGKTTAQAARRIGFKQVSVKNV